MGPNATSQIRRWATSRVGATGRQDRPRNHSFPADVMGATQKFGEEKARNGAIALGGHGDDGSPLPVPSSGVSTLQSRAATSYPKPPFPEQKQAMPGLTSKMQPVPDHGEASYQGAGRLRGRNAVITGGDSGIGRAVALAYAREGANVLISYLDEEEDAQATRRLVEDAGCKALLMGGDIQIPRTAGRSSPERSRSSGASTFSSTTPRIRRASKRSRTFPTRSGN